MCCVICISFEDELPCRSGRIQEDYRETDGSADVNTHVDFTLDELFATSNEETVPDPYTGPAKEAKRTEFAAGEPVNVNFFLANRSNVILDDTYEGGNKVPIDWQVIRDSDGIVVASGSEAREFNNYKKVEQGAMLYLNKTETGAYEAWQPGAYTVTVSFNKNKKFRESYYRNNYDGVVHFTVKEKSKPDKKKNPITVTGKKATVRYSKLKKKNQTVKRSKVLTVRYSKGTVTYKKTSGSKKITINKKTGNVTVKKGLKKGTYTIKVKVSDTGNDKYKAGSTTAVFRIKVK